MAERGARPCAAMIAVGAVSALGVGEAAYRAAEPGAAARVAWGVDPVLSAAGLGRPFAGRAPSALEGAGALEDRASALLACALGQLTRGLDELRPGWRGERIAIALGTSSGGMLSAERFFAARAERTGGATGELARRATYFAPMSDALDAYGLGGVRRRTLLLAACAASTLAIGLGVRWLERGACDLVIAGGFDALSVFVASGFEALRATTASMPRPFRKGRDGMCLGEGAGLVALVRHGEEGGAPGADAPSGGARPRLFVLGFGASTDAVHITAPDPTGGGLSRAALAALADAGQSEVDLVSAHATATPYNDAMEARAIRAAVPGRPVVHPFKAQIGHTLGAAGVLETLAASDALTRGIAPCAAGEGEIDPDAEVTLLATSEARPLARALKLSAAFGGANAALVISARPEVRPARPRRDVSVAAGAHVTDVDLAALSAVTGVARDRLARLDGLCRLGLAAVAALAEKVGRDALRGAGIAAGHGLATIETNEAFDARRRSRGPTGVEPRAFPATSPNAVAGECAIVYKLTGPSFAVGAGLDGATEALAGAAELVAAGDADQMVVVAADDAGPVARDLLAAAGLADRRLARGAVALLLRPGESGAPVDLDRTADHERGPVGHLALLRWLDAG